MVSNCISNEKSHFFMNKVFRRPSNFSPENIFFPLISFQRSSFPPNLIDLLFSLVLICLSFLPVFSSWFNFVGRLLLINFHSFRRRCRAAAIQSPTWSEIYSWCFFTKKLKFTKPRLGEFRLA